MKVKHKENLSNSNFINSRFGKLKINRDKAIFFPNGLLGMTEFKKFSLCKFPNPKFVDFQILQSLESEELSFIVLPVNNESEKYANIIKEELVTECCDDLQISKEEMAFLMITSIERDKKTNNANITVNARAPLIINTSTRNGIQYVFPHENLDIRHQIQI